MPQVLFPVLKTPREVGRTRTAHGCRAFTLIELLVVIAVMAILASLVLPVTWAVNRAKIVSRSRAEMEEIVSAIEAYKAKLGHYPPDNDDYSKNQLYYELAGTKLNNQVYQTLDGGATINETALPTAIGPKVTGLVNVTRGSAGDEAGVAKNFLKGMKSTRVAQRPNGAKVLVGLPWQMGANPPFDREVILGEPGINPWRYNSSSPTNNPGTYDLWITVRVGSKTKLICNWNKQALDIKTWY